MYRDDDALQAFTSCPNFQTFQSAVKESKPVRPPAAEWVDRVAVSYQIF